jgi:cytochrome c oxidase cbb3-type subunit 1
VDHLCRFIDHGHASHTARDQILGLGSLFVWIPLAGWHLAAFAWPNVARRWLVSAYVCWGLLVASGWVTFLPGWSEALKFTHGLVAHAHLAMAGTGDRRTSRTAHLPGPGPRRIRGAPPPHSWAFLTWHLGLAVHLLSLFLLSMLEEANPAGLFLSDGPSQAPDGRAGTFRRRNAGRFLFLAETGLVPMTPLTSTSWACRLSLVRRRT